MSTLFEIILSKRVLWRSQKNADGTKSVLRIMYVLNKVFRGNPDAGPLTLVTGGAVAGFGGGKHWWACRASATVSMDTLASVARATTPADPNSITCRQEQALPLSPATMSQPQRQRGADVSPRRCQAHPLSQFFAKLMEYFCLKASNQLRFLRRCLPTVLGFGRDFNNARRCWFGSFIIWRFYDFFNFRNALMNCGNCSTNIVLVLS